MKKSMIFIGMIAGVSMFVTGCACTDKQAYQIMNPPPPRPPQMMRVEVIHYHVNVSKNHKNGLENMDVDSYLAERANAANNSDRSTKIIKHSSNGGSTFYYNKNGKEMIWKLVEDEIEENSSKNFGKRKPDDPQQQPKTSTKKPNTL